MASLNQDVIGGMRFLRKRPAFTAVAIFTLALGIGATTLVYTVVSTLLLRPQPYPRPERLVMVWEDYVSHDQKHLIAAAEFADLKRQAGSLDRLSAVDLVSCGILSRSLPEHATMALVSSDYFPLLGAHAAIGRTFLAQEDGPGRGQEVVLSHRLWQRRFGADPRVVGQRFDLQLIRDFGPRRERPSTFTVVGVMPADFESPTPDMDVDLWAPIALTPGPEETVHHLLALGRLRAGVSLARAQAQVDALAVHFATLGLVHQDHFRCNLVPLREFLAGYLRPALLVLLFAAGFVLVIACSNVANLILAQGASRHSEMAIRATLGASRGQLIRRLLIESALLGLLGGIAGLLLCYGSLELLVALSPADFPRVHQIKIDSQVLGFACALSLLTAVISGLAPGLHSSRAGILETLKGSTRSTAGRQARRLGSTLVLSEVALAVVLLIAAGLLARSFQRLVAVDTGFNPKNLLVLRISLPEVTFPVSAKRLAFLDRCLEMLESQPGIRAAGASNLFPLRGWNTDTDFLVEGRPDLTAANAPKADWRAVTAGYFRTLGIPLLQGRSFTELELKTGAPVVVVNQALARRFWPRESPIGKRLKQLVTGVDVPWLSVIGVAANVRNEDLGSAAAPAIYTQTYWFPTVSLGVRTADEPAALAESVRRVIWGLDKDVVVQDVSRMTDIVHESVSQPRLSAAILGGFALLALILAAVGIYGVLAFATSQRAKEIGLRMALGAGRRQVLELVVAQGMTPVLTGLLLGLAVAAGLTRYLSSLLFGVAATDPLTFCAGPSVLVGVALAACLVPAWRATRIDPASSLNA